MKLKTGLFDWNNSTMVVFSSVFNGKHTVVLKEENESERLKFEEERLKLVTIV